MGVPKRKVAHSRQGERRAHHALSAPKLVECSHCHQPKLPHRACPNCGYYRGRPAIDVRQKKTEEPST